MDDGDNLKLVDEGIKRPLCHQQRFSQNSDGWTVVKVGERNFVFMTFNAMFQEGSAVRSLCTGEHAMPW